MSTFSGLGVAMVTPFNENHQMDFPAIERLVNHMVEGGVDYLVVQGTTGESPALTKDEKRRLLDFILEINRERVPVVYGIGGNNTKAVCESLESWDMQGLSGILSVSPYYNKPTQEGIYQHYKALSESTDQSIILYNVPGRTGSNVLSETTVRIAEDCKNIVAVKEASGDVDQIQSIIDHAPEGFEVISGDDAITLDLIKRGASGVISVVGNAFPQSMSNLVHAAIAGDLATAELEQSRLEELIDGLFAEGNPAGVKECLLHANLCKNYVRLPLVTVSKNLSEKLYRLMAENDLVVSV